MDDIRNTGRDRSVVNALQMRGWGTYGLGKGNGNHPNAGLPLDSKGRCDCSNFVNWCVGNVLDGGWGAYSNTDGILLDAYGMRQDGTAVTPKIKAWGPRARHELPRPGDIIVSGKGFKIGHVGIISQVLPEFPLDRTNLPKFWFRDEGYQYLRVIHCAKWRGVPPAIRETDAMPWKSDGYLATYLHFEGGGP